MDFNNIDDLLKHMQKDINDALVTDVADGAKDVLVDAIDDVVYDAYTPGYYQRRTSGGLGDPSTMEATKLQDGVVMVKSYAKLNDDYGVNNNEIALDEIVSTGHGYMYTHSSGSLNKAAYEEPRDFYAEAQKRLDNGKAKELLKGALKKRGYTVE